jgi:hypothetical protein
MARSIIIIEAGMGGRKKRQGGEGGTHLRAKRNGGWVNVEFF